MSDLFLSNLVGTLKSYFRIGGMRLSNAANAVLEVKDRAGTLFKGLRASRLSLRTESGDREVTLRIPSNPTSDLDLLLPVVDGSAETGLSTDGAGNLSWRRYPRVRASGTATLTFGNAVVTTVDISDSRVVILSIQTVAGSFGTLAVASRVTGTSFSVVSSSALDASTFSWIIIDP
jgi:hypothetical protein